jgi:transcriptional regulator with XRE-family HTH domain
MLWLTMGTRPSYRNDARRDQTELLRWARERSGLDPAVLAHRFPQLDTWERRESSPTLKQLESFAKATHTSVGYLFLQEPPVERVPIPDFSPRVLV